jgi:hypothetical protein
MKHKVGRDTPRQAIAVYWFDGWRFNDGFHIAISV